MTPPDNGDTKLPLVPENIHLKFEQISPPSPAPNFFQDLPSEQKENLYRRLELKKALTVSKIQSEDEDWVISKAFKEAISWKTKTIDLSSMPYHPNWIVPRKKGFLTVDVETDFVAHQVGKLISKGSSNQEVGLFGGLYSEEESESYGSSSLKAERNSYLLAEYTIPKVILSVGWENIELNSDFKTKIEPLTNIDNEWSSFVKLNHLLNEYGYFVPLKFTIGGKISAQSKVNSKVDSNSQEFTSFQSSFASRLNLFGRPESEASSTSLGYTQASQNMSSESNMELEYYGGIGSAAMNPMGWMASLEYYIAWTVIKYSELVPIICFFDEDLRNKAIRAFMRYSYYPDTDKPLLLNGISYASLAVELMSKRSFFQGDPDGGSGFFPGDPDRESRKLTMQFFNQKKPKKFNLLFSYRKNTESPSSDQEDLSQP
ncbi:MAG: hypothetical protein F6K23_02640 [Okeania sp. SIO2C9]|uniref:MAC/perforin domain-containing protein n=1 Tax=Okeania sp. SIO2C9 TaxID=2607791 RepID=UPI0013C06719|nr:MAC/perforin domain-containing protein [Okeania sp. SIO2C9]NEQ72070.1 hypothetical protein [Okeania sp. SIO2C9]